MQTLRTKKSRNHWGQKISRNLSEQKNQATSQNKKIRQPLGTKKNHATSRDKKEHLTSHDGRKNPVTSRDQKKSSNLSGRKEITQSLR